MKIEEVQSIITDILMIEFPLTNFRWTVSLQNWYVLRATFQYDRELYRGISDDSWHEWINSNAITCATLSQSLIDDLQKMATTDPITEISRYCIDSLKRYHRTFIKTRMEKIH